MTVPSFKDADIAKSLLISISNDIGQIACLNAKIHGLNRIIFGGYFIRGHPMTMHTITYAINYWSKVGCPLTLHLMNQRVYYTSISNVYVGRGAGHVPQA